MAALLEELQRAFRWVDAIDIALVAAFFYGVLSWFKQTASRSVLVGVFLLALVYFMARAFDMYMTALLFQAVAAVLLVTLVVVFQEDLRRAFERLGTWGKIAEKKPFPSDFSYFEILSEAAAGLAAKRTGALIVIRGKEPLDRHLHGGVPLNGQLSAVLLDSIFDSHSAGHDGAVIVENGQVTCFACHLPLSRSSQSSTNRGTRHTAAIGLSERCDALVIVVSEERGRISVAEHGQLRQMASVVDLEERLEHFWKANFPQPNRSQGWRLLREDFALKAGALALACMAWFFLSHRVVPVQQSFTLPIEFRNVPSNLVVTETDPVAANVTLTGPERAFYLLDPTTLKVSFNLSDISEGPQELMIEDRNITCPTNLSVYRANPELIRLIVHRLAPVTLSVEAPVQGELPAGLRLVNVRTEPRRLQALSWQPSSNTILTEPIDLSTISQTKTLKARLVVPEHLRMGQAPEIQVTIEVAPQTAEVGAE